MTDDGKSRSWFRVVLEIVAVLAAVAGAVTAWQERQDKIELARDVEQIRAQLAQVQTQLQQSQQTVRRREQEIRESAATFFPLYAERVRAASDACRAYEAFDTAANRAELGSKFETEHARRLETARRELLALVSLAKEWRPYLEALFNLTNGEIAKLESDVAQNRIDEMLRQIAIIERNLQSRRAQLEAPPTQAR